MSVIIPSVSYNIPANSFGCEDALTSRTNFNASRAMPLIFFFINDPQPLTLSGCFFLSNHEVQKSGFSAVQPIANLVPQNS